jgi:hypothetical protein
LLRGSTATTTGATSMCRFNRVRVSPLSRVSSSYPSELNEWDREMKPKQYIEQNITHCPTHTHYHTTTPCTVAHQRIHQPVQPDTGLHNVREVALPCERVYLLKCTRLGIACIMCMYGVDECICVYVCVLHECDASIKSMLTYMYIYIYICVCAQRFTHTHTHSHTHTMLCVQRQVVVAPVGNPTQLRPA